MSEWTEETATANVKFWRDRAEAAEAKFAAIEHAYPGEPFKRIEELEAELAASRERERKLREALDSMNKLIPHVMDALESDAQLDVRREAWDALAEAYEEAHPWSAALRDSPECRHGGRQRGETPCPDCSLRESEHVCGGGPCSVCGDQG